MRGGAVPLPARASFPVLRDRLADVDLLCLSQCAVLPVAHRIAQPQSGVMSAAQKTAPPVVGSFGGAGKPFSLSLWRGFMLRYRVLTSGYMETASENAVIDVLVVSIVLGLALSLALIVKATAWELFR